MQIWPNRMMIFCQSVSARLIAGHPMLFPSAASVVKRALSRSIRATAWARSSLVRTAQSKLAFEPFKLNLHGLLQAVPSLSGTTMPMSRPKRQEIEP